MAKKVKLPKDVNQRAKKILDIVTGNEDKKEQVDDVKSAAATLGRKGGLKGGKARAEILSSERKREIAKKAAAVRWGHKKD